MITYKQKINEIHEKNLFLDVVYIRKVGFALSCFEATHIGNDIGLFSMPLFNNVKQEVFHVSMRNDEKKLSEYKSRLDECSESIRKEAEYNKESFLETGLKYMKGK